MEMKSFKKIQKLSYKKKLFLLFNLLFTLLILFMLVLAFIFGKSTSNQLYENHREKLNIASTSIRQALQDVENLPQAIARDQGIIDNLTQINQMNVSVATKNTLRTQLQQEVNVLRLNIKNIKDVYLLDQHGENQVGFIYDSANLSNGLGLKTIQQRLGKNRQGQWFFAKNLTSAVFAQPIYPSDWQEKAPLGLLVITVDTSFITKTISQLSQFSSQDFFVLRAQNQFYATGSPVKGYQTYLQKQQKALGNSTKYRVDRIDHRRYFVLADTGPEFVFYYFMLNQQIIFELLKMILLLLLFISLILGLLFLIFHDTLNRLFYPIQHLANLMSKFKGEGDLAKLEVTTNEYPGKDDGDEVAVLYRSFDSMIETLNHLVIKNYQAKILSQEMELKSLQSQLDPHFLYNTLDSINWMALSKGERDISEMVTSLAFLFRKKIDNQATYSTVQAEVAIVEAYLKIQSIRFGERLAYQVEIDPATNDYSVPHLILQPLVENSIKYALEKMEGGYCLKLTSFLTSKQLILQVIDNGPGFEQPKQASNSTNLGLKNIESRLKILYGDQAKLTITSNAYQETKVTIRIPIKKGANRDETSDRS